MLPSIEHRLAAEIAAKPVQIAAAIALLDEGASVPFISRYRKEATGGLDDAQLRMLEDRLRYLRELEDRRATIIASITEQNKMTPELLKSISLAEDKTHLEDLYLPYKPKRRTKVQIAQEAGLEPLADALLANPMLNPEDQAAQYLREPFTTEAGDNPGVPDAKAALDGARQILMERFSEDAGLLQWLRDYVQEHGIVESKVREGKEAAAEKYADYFDYSESITTLPSHRALALFRGRREDMLDVRLRLDSEEERLAWSAPHNPCEVRIAGRFGIQDQNRPADRWLMDTVRFSWRVKSFMHLELELMGALRDRAETDAINVFARNLKALLLAAPAGPRVTMGLDPGIRTGVKVAVTDETGKVLDTATVYPHQPKNDWDGSLHTLARLAEKHRVTVIAIGNGTASRETDKLARDLIKLRPELKLTSVVVSEAGASVYSASEFASRELPELDVSLRGAVSIARRLQDPLAELVKIDPKSIGVGQYQHDLNPGALARRLDAVVEDCVNAVGVDLNTASVPLLARVSGLTPSVAASIVRWRDAHGAFRSRAQLLDVAGLGPKTFEQAAGFLRIRDGDNPLDMTGVHPETYALVQKMISATGRPIDRLMGASDVLKSLKPEAFADERFGAITVKDILAELEKPGRDPRPDFKVARFNEGVNDLQDLKPGMLLEGTVSNVAQFGAFVDLGVHQDGLVHVSQLANRFVSDAREIVKTGDIVNVRVVEVDLARKRIALTMKLDAKPAAKVAAAGFRPAARSEKVRPAAPRTGSAMAEAFAKLRSGR